MAVVGSAAAARSGRRAAQCAISWRSPSSRSWLRSGSGAVTINDFIWVWAWARAATALRRATRSARSASTAPTAVLRDAGGPAGLGGAGGGLGVDRVGLALPAAGLAVRAVDLDQLDPGHPQMQRQPGPVGAGALDPDLVQLARSARSHASSSA